MIQLLIYAGWLKDRKLYDALISVSSLFTRPCQSVNLSICPHVSSTNDFRSSWMERKVRGCKQKIVRGILHEPQIKFYRPTESRMALGPTQPPVQWIPGVLSLGIKRQEREAYHSPLAPTSRMRGTIPLLPNTSPLVVFTPLRFIIL
jgi:hypothetical protein